MNTLIKLEEAGKFIGCYMATLYLGYSWWLFPALLLLPDLSMLGYVINQKVGAVTYNIVHHQGLALVILFAGILFKLDWMVLTGIILFGHSSMDRVLGYGLKYFSGFQDTHLGKIGKKSA